MEQTYSVQNDHLHLMAEGKDRHELSRHMRILFSRIALAVNSIAKRRGSLFRDRHHRSELTSPTQTRNALVYVLFNERKHHAQNGGAISEAFLLEVDDCSSVAWLGVPTGTSARVLHPSCSRGYVPATATSKGTALHASNRGHGSPARAGARAGTAAPSTCETCLGSSEAIASVLAAPRSRPLSVLVPEVDFLGSASRTDADAGGQPDAGRFAHPPSCGRSWSAPNLNETS